MGRRYSALAMPFVFGGASMWLNSRATRLRGERLRGRAKNAPGLMSAMGHLPTSARQLSWSAFSRLTEHHWSGHAASASTILKTGFETTNRDEGGGLFRLTAFAAEQGRRGGARPPSG
jgi:hypothetical protein